MEAAFFDLDKTIIARSGPLALGRSFFREGLITRSSLLKSMWAQFVFHLMGADEGKMERLREEAAKLTSGWEAEKVRSVVEEVLEEVISPLIYAEALELMHDHRAAGRLVCIVSSSPEEIVAPLARMLRVETWIATRAKIEDGRYTGELDFYAYGPHKPEAIKELAAEMDIDLEGSFAYSDSVTDLPMLELVGNPVVVNPDKELRRVALEKEWQIEMFRNPVSLRERLPSVNLPNVRDRIPAMNVRDRLPAMNLPNVRERFPTVDARMRTERPDPRVVAAAIALVGGLAWWRSRRRRASDE